MTTEQDAKRRKTARHEAGHAVAALHYNCPMEIVSISPEGGSLGTTRLGVSKLSDAIVVFCGPLAEKDWGEFVPGQVITCDNPVGGDLDALIYLQMTDDESLACREEALIFLCKPEVQGQIDRVADALLDSVTLGVGDVRAISGFTESLASDSCR